MSNVTERLSNEVASTTCWVVANGVAVTLWPPDGPMPHSPDQRRPLLYLVAPGGPEPPVTGEDLADWVQLPGDAEEVRKRARRLMARARASGTVLAYVDADDVLRVGDRLAVLSPIEARIMRILLDHAGKVVSRTHINREIWPAKAPDDFSILNNRVKLLRDHSHGCRSASTPCAPGVFCSRSHRPRSGWPPTSLDPSAPRPGRDGAEAAAELLRRDRGSARTAAHPAETYPVDTPARPTSRLLDPLPTKSCKRPPRPAHVTATSTPPCFLQRVVQCSGGRAAGGPSCDRAHSLALRLGHVAVGETMGDRGGDRLARGLAIQTAEERA